MQPLKHTRILYLGFLNTIDIYVILRYYVHKHTCLNSKRGDHISGPVI